MKSIVIIQYEILPLATTWMTLENTVFVIVDV